MHDEPEPAPTPLQHLPGARWRELTEAEGRARYDLLAVTDDSIDYDDVFGGDPISFFVHTGDLQVQGPLLVANDGQRAVFVVEGSLTVDGTLVVVDNGPTAPLWVRGALTADTLGVFLNAHLLVEEDVAVQGTLVFHLRDSGHFVVNGDLTAGLSIASSFDGALYLPETELPPLSGDELAARWTDEVGAMSGSPRAIALAVAAGRPLLKA